MAVAHDSHNIKVVCEELPEQLGHQIVVIGDQNPRPAGHCLLLR
jgi:hypothetical protein